jgi:arylsulfatase A-like enzyme
MKTYATKVAGEAPCPDGELPCEVAATSYATVDTADDAIALAGALREPWFLYVAFNAAHAPVHDVPSGLPRSKCDGYEAPPARELGPDASTPQRVRRMLEEADAQIARVLCALDASDTAVILIGDNGTSLDAILPPYDAAHSKQTLYEGVIHVPLIVRWPGAKKELAGTFDDALVSSTDVFATIVEIAGAAAASDDSFSLVPRLRGRADVARRTCYVEEFAPNFAPDPKTGGPPSGYSARMHGQALRDARFKLIRTTWIDAKNGGARKVEEELYDLLEGGPVDRRVDPPRPTRDFFEVRDLTKETLAPDSAAAKALTALRRELDELHPCLVRP